MAHQRVAGLERRLRLAGGQRLRQGDMVAGSRHEIVLPLEEVPGTADQRLQADMRTTAAILEVNLPNSDIFWNEDGSLGKVEAKAMPKFRNHDLIDTIGRVTGDTATLFVYDPETQDFVRKTTTILDADGNRIL